MEPGRAGETAATDPVPSPAIPGVAIGRVVGCDALGTLLVDYPGNCAGTPLPAARVSADAPGIGQEVALMFEGGDPRRPLVIGPIHRPSPAPGLQPTQTFDISADGQRIAVHAEREIVLRCGEASITLTRAGKVLIRGTFVSTRASGVNRIKGGSVQIN